jgi:hypothetical protein
MIRIGARFYRKTILSGAACATLLLSAGFIISNAQQGGTITGRVVNDEGAGMPNVTVHGGGPRGFASWKYRSHHG